MSLKLTINGHLHSTDEADAKRIEFIAKYDKGHNVDFVREAIDCLMEATRLYGHWSMMAKRDPEFVERILAEIGKIKRVKIEDNEIEEAVTGGLNFGSGDTFFDEE